MRPKKIYVDFSNIPPCNFGALWYEEPVREWTDKEGKTRFEIAMIARAVVQGNTIDEKVEEVW